MQGDAFRHVLKPIEPVKGTNRETESLFWSDAFKQLERQFGFGAREDAFWRENLRRCGVKLAENTRTTLKHAQEGGDGRDDFQNEDR